jgi:hypothetical protein
MNFTPRFECELPQDVRRELGKPKRPAILRRPPVPEHSDILKWIGAFALTVIVLAGVIGHYTQQQQSPAAAPVQPAPIPIATPPPVGIAPTPAPRAALVKLPAPRAMLVGEPIPAAAQLFPSGRTPMWRQTGEAEWTIWQPGNPDYIYLVDAACTISRATALGKAVRDFAPRAEPVAP